MSGGSMNYLYSKVLHCADFSLDTPEREAFAKHLKLVSQALHDIEWVDSGDYGPGDETAAIQACLNPAPPQQATPSMSEIERLRAERDALAQRLREVRALLADTTERVMNAWAEQRLARHGIPMPEAPTCPDCHGIGYDASGQTCACQENPSF